MSSTHYTASRAYGIVVAMTATRGSASVTIIRDKDSAAWQKPVLRSPDIETSNAAHAHNYTAELAALLPVMADWSSRVTGTTSTTPTPTGDEPTAKPKKKSAASKKTAAKKDKAPSV